MIRTFLAVELSEALRTNLARLQLDLKQRLSREIPRNVRMSWIQPASIHLTIKFLGDIDEQLVSPMQEAMGQAIAGHPRLQIPLERLGGFPRLQQPRVLWVGPSDEWEQGEEARRLTSVHRAIEECCCSFDLAPENRPLSPHLTIARIKEGGYSMGQALAKSGVMDRPLSLGSLAVDSVVLMRSELKPTGSVYTKLWDVKVGAREE
jgi:RNA 2',3'-cyclic 3'-phosphodiesterase